MIQPAADETWHGVAADPDARSLPGLVVYRFAGSLYYANANLFFEQASARSPARPIRPAGSASTPPPSPTSTTAAARPSASSTASSQAHGIKLVIAEAMEPVRAELDRYGLTELLGHDAIFPTVHDAVQRFNELHPATDR